MASMDGVQDHLYSCYNPQHRHTSRHQDLRSLLDTENSFCLMNLANGCCNTHWGGQFGGRPMKGYTQQYFGHCRTDRCDSSHAYQGYFHWRYWFCAPPGTTNITFELWGGGGSGARACCCQYGNPGGAGAYAIKTLCAQCNPATGLPFEGGTFGGMCWEMFVGPPTCEGQCCKGSVGCKSYVTGCGLSNFCADGGMPGKTCCYAFRCGRCCDNDTGNYSARGAQETNCLNEYRPCYPMACSGMYTFHPCEATYTCDCSCYYGADWGVPGKLGWFRSDCCENTCFTKLGVPSPGGMFTRCTRFSVMRNMGNACFHETQACQHGEDIGWCVSGQAIGRGGLSGTACAGPSCNGQCGTGGLIRVHYW
jgi:hypothetical protein